MHLFPHNAVRKHQDELIATIRNGLEAKHNLVLHAPTGLGKTVSSLVPAVELALEKKLTVFFLTARHTQHQIAIDTLRKMQEKTGQSIGAISLLGKKWFCLQGGASSLPTREFAEYCKHMVETEKCEYYTNTRKKGKLSVEAQHVAETLAKSINDSKEIIQRGQQHTLCPYELGIALARGATVIITDYYYWFSEPIRTGLLKKMDKSMGQCIVIADEAHNLPDRIKDLATERLTVATLQYAAQEAKRYSTQQLLDAVRLMEKTLQSYAQGMHQQRLLDKTPKEEIRFNERIVAREDFISKVEAAMPYDELASALFEVAEDVIAAQQRSSLLGVAQFLEAWKQELEGFTRILSVGDKHITLSYRCLDPSVVSRAALNDCYASLLMSGTLTPTGMYRELLGVDNVEERVFLSPFPQQNRKTIIVPQTSTKYETRGPEQFQRIAKVLSGLLQAIPGNCLVFFPSYYLQQRVQPSVATHKTVLSEVAGLTKDDRNDLLNRFRQYKESGAVLFGVIGGSFAEGIDLPGEEVKGVVIVGLPLGKPDLETQSLIQYYDAKFKKGWEYGYVFPAFTKTVQGAGRCIRSEADRGVMVFVDERYAWPKYKACFPQDWELVITQQYENVIQEFFRRV